MVRSSPRRAKTIRTANEQLSSDVEIITSSGPGPSSSKLMKQGVSNKNVNNGNSVVRSSPRRRSTRQDAIANDDNDDDEDEPPKKRNGRRSNLTNLSQVNPVTEKASLNGFLSTSTSIPSSSATFPLKDRRDSGAIIKHEENGTDQDQDMNSEEEAVYQQAVKLLHSSTSHTTSNGKLPHRTKSTSSEPLSDLPADENDEDEDPFTKISTKAEDDDDDEPPKKKARSKRKAGSSMSKSKPDTVKNENDEVESIPATPKPAKKKRVKKYKGPALPPMTYPERNHKSRKFVGTHVSISEGAHYAPHRALRLGAKAFGLFTKTQKAWKGPPLSEDTLKLFPMRCKGLTETIPNDEDGSTEVVKLADGIGFDVKKHVVPHGSYLTNLCNPGKDMQEKSWNNFMDELQRAESLGIGLFNFHPGSTVGQGSREDAYKLLAENINRAHRETQFIVILLENMARANNTIGGSFEDLAAIISHVENKDRVGVCIDTCHMFAYGYDMRTAETYNATMEEFDRVVGLQYVKAFHCNDSKKDLGSHADLHENIGAGKIGLLGFQCLMQDQRFDDIPFILETPMLQATLQVDASPSKRQTSGKIDSARKRDAVKIEDSEVALDNVEAEEVQSNDAGLTVGASTWKMEIQLLHALETVPLGETNQYIDYLADSIKFVVGEYKTKADSAKQAKKDEKAKLKAEQKAAKLEEEEGDDMDDDEPPKKTTKSKRKRRRVKVEDVESVGNYSQNSASGGRGKFVKEECDKEGMDVEDHEGCDSHGESD